MHRRAHPFRQEMRRGASASAGTVKRQRGTNPPRWAAATPTHPLHTGAGSREHVPRFRARGMGRRRGLLVARSRLKPSAAKTSAICPNADLRGQIVMGGRVNSRWLQAPDLNLHLDFQKRMITADSLLRYQPNQSLKRIFFGIEARLLRLGNVPGNNRAASLWAHRHGSRRTEFCSRRQSASGVNS